MTSQRDRAEPPAELIDVVTSISLRYNCRLKLVFFKVMDKEESDRNSKLDFILGRGRHCLHHYQSMYVPALYPESTTGVLSFLSLMWMDGWEIKIANIFISI